MTWMFLYFIPDLPLVEQFILEGVLSNVMVLHVAWLDNKIYIMQSDRKRVRVFTDHTPITEISTPIHIEKLGVTNCMVASTLSKSIFISDRFCIWKIQLPDNKLSRIWVHREPDHLSITLNNELLAVMGDTSFDIVIFSLENFSMTKSIAVPFHCYDICCAAQLPNENIVISYGIIEEDSLYQICILTAKGDVIKKFDPNMFESFPSNSWCPTYFSVIDDGQIVFIGDSIDNRLFVFNSQMTDCHLLSNIQLDSNDIPKIVYIKDRQQLLLCEERSHTIYLSMLHLSPCNLIRGRTTKSLLPASNKSRIKRKHKVKKSSTRNFQKLGLKKWR